MPNRIDKTKQAETAKEVKCKVKMTAWKRPKRDCCDTDKGKEPPKVETPLIEISADGNKLKISVQASHPCGIAQVEIKVTILEQGAKSPWETNATNAWDSCPSPIDEFWEWVRGTKPDGLPVNLVNCVVTVECTVLNCCNRWATVKSKARLKS
jgi:hypothetical protein